MGKEKIDIAGPSRPPKTTADERAIEHDGRGHEAGYGPERQKIQAG
jgi:hypothetical protein